MNTVYFSICQTYILELPFLIEDTYTIKLLGFSGGGNSESHKMARNKEKETSSVFMERVTLLFLSLWSAAAKSGGGGANGSIHQLITVDLHFNVPPPIYYCIIISDYSILQCTAQFPKQCEIS